jgi:hypothetical protein
VSRLCLFAIALVVSASLSHAALAADQLTGADGAYLDWGVKNCGLQSTVKEHDLVAQANARDSGAFLKGYNQKSASKELGDALAVPARTADMCSDIKTWYGPSGSRIAGLVTWKDAPAAAAAPAKKAAAEGGKKGRGQKRQ